MNQIEKYKELNEDVRLKFEGKLMSIIEACQLLHDELESTEAYSTKDGYWIYSIVPSSLMCLALSTLEYLKENLRPAPKEGDEND